MVLDIHSLCLSKSKTRAWSPPKPGINFQKCQGCLFSRLLTSPLRHPAPVEPPAPQCAKCSGVCLFVRLVWFFLCTRRLFVRLAGFLFNGSFILKAGLGLLQTPAWAGSHCDGAMSRQTNRQADKLTKLALPPNHPPNQSTNQRNNQTHQDGLALSSPHRKAALSHQRRPC